MSRPSKLPEQQIPAFTPLDNEWRNIEFSPLSGKFYLRLRHGKTGIWGGFDSLEQAVSFRQGLTEKREAATA